MAVGDVLLSVNDTTLTGVDFQVMCQRVAQSSSSPIRRFLVRRDAQQGPLRFDLPQGHLGMNFDRQTKSIISFQRVPGPGQLAIPRIGVGDVLEEINGSPAGTKNHGKRGSLEWKTVVSQLDQYILESNHPV